MLLLIGMVSGGAGYGLYRAGRAYLERSPWSRLETVRVEGVKRVPERDVIAASGLRAGLNIMKLPLETIAGKIERIPAIRSAKIIRKIPHRVIVRIEEREAVGCIFLDKLQLVDEDGALFPIIGPGEVIDLPVLTGDVDPSAKGKSGFQRAVKFLKNVKEAYPTVFSHLGEVSVSGSRLQIRLVEGGAAVLADDPAGPSNLVKLEQFLLQRSGELTPRSQYVDLRYPAMIVTGVEG